MLAPKQRRVSSPIESDRFEGRSKNRQHRIGGRVEVEEERMRSAEGGNSPYQTANNGSSAGRRGKKGRREAKMIKSAAFWGWSWFWSGVFWLWLWFWFSLLFLSSASASASASFLFSLLCPSQGSLRSSDKRQRTRTGTR